MINLQRCVFLQLRKSCKVRTKLSSCALEGAMGRSWPKKTCKVGITGIPFSKGQPREGTENSPNMLRQAGLVETIESYGNKVTDFGDLELELVPNDEPWNKVKNPRTVGLANKKIADIVSKITRDCQTVVNLGGDHSVAIGSICGHMQTKPDIVLVWVDAHADLNTPFTSYTGNIHGMPLSFVIKEMYKYTSPVPGFEWLHPCISAKDIVYIALRDVDQAERTFIETLGIKSYSMSEVDKYGIQEVVDRALTSIDPSGKRPLHVSFDVDAIDPDLTPSTGTPVAGGLTLREALCMAEEIYKTGRLSVLDVVEVNTHLGTEEQKCKTVTTTIELVAHFFGKKREGYVSETMVVIPQVSEMKVFPPKKET